MKYQIAGLGNPTHPWLYYLVSFIQTLVVVAVTSLVVSGGAMMSLLLIPPLFWATMTIRRMYGPRKFFLTIGDTKEIWGKFHKKSISVAKPMTVLRVEFDESQITFLGVIEGQESSLVIRSSGFEWADYQLLCQMLANPLNIESTESAGKVKVQRNTKMTSISIGDWRHHGQFLLLVTGLGVALAIGLARLVL